MIEIEEYGSYEEVHPLWRGLNQRYKEGELALDWKIHAKLWNQFRAVIGTQLKIVVGFEAGECIGIFPFAGTNRQGDNDQVWMFCDDSIISREYFCSPRKINSLINYLPRHLSTDLSCFYRPDDLSAFISQPGCVVDLKPTEKEYLESIGPKRRAEYLKTIKLNQDLEVVADHMVREALVADLREKYIDYCRTKIEMDFAVFQRAEEMGKLVALYIFHESKLIAANFAVLREHNRVDDYLCLRDTDRVYSKRRLGILAIIKNMQFCRWLGVRYYDLSDFRAAYKDGFINTGLCYWEPRQPLDGLHSINA
jgi:hypothetical protein